MILAATFVFFVVFLTTRAVSLGLVFAIGLVLLASVALGTSVVALWLIPQGLFWQALALAIVFAFAGAFAFGSKDSTLDPARYPIGTLLRVLPTQAPRGRMREKS